MATPSRTRTPSEPAVPEGLRHLPAFLARAEHDELWHLLEGWSFEELRLHGQPAKRTARHFGASYDLERRSTGPAPPLPPELEPLRQRAADAVGLPPERFAEVLVLRYPQGSGIGWHRDAPPFGSPVFGVSIGSPCVLRFQRRLAGKRLVHALELHPGSAYVLDGPARWSWQHAITATPGRRYSVTFRTLRRDEPGAGGAAPSAGTRLDP